MNTESRFFSSRSLGLNMLLAVTVVVIFAAFVWGFEKLPVAEWSEAASDFAKRNGALGVIGFAAIYVLATLCLFPCAFLTIAAGMMYGAWGIPLVIVSATIGATIAFLLARYLAFAKVNSLFERKPFTRALKTAIENEGLLFMVLLRVSPLIPFNLNNYLMGAAPVRFTSYLIATIIGTIPGTLLYIYLGTFGRGTVPQPEMKWLILGLGFVATIALGKLALQRTRSILAASV